MEALLKVSKEQIVNVIIARHNLDKLQVSDMVDIYTRHNHIDIDHKMSFRKDDLIFVVRRVLEICLEEKELAPNLAQKIVEQLS